MWNNISHVNGSKVVATDGEIGHVRQAFFDDQTWTIRYLVIDTGNWLSGREVLISPYAVVQPLGSGKIIDVALTQRKVMDSPPVDTHQPVSRQHERETLGYYTFPEYWDGGDLWSISALPLLPAALPTAVEPQEVIARREEKLPAEDFHLRSSASVTGHEIQASDGSIGHVRDFIFDDESWTIRYLVVDTSNWWPLGHQVLLATHWIDSIDWADKTVVTSLTRAQVRNSPKYEEAAPLNRDYEKRLHDAYSRVGYWD
jgi:uncharacterized protein YrrD